MTHPKKKPAAPKPVKGWAVIEEGSSVIDPRCVFPGLVSAEWYRDSHGIWSRIIPVLITPL